MHTAFAGLLRLASPDHTLSYVAMVRTGSAFVTDERLESAPRDASRVMTRILVLCCRPMHLSPSDAEKWLREEVSGVLADSAVAQIQITTLLSASSTWGRAWDYLIAIELRDGARRRCRRQRPVRALICSASCVSSGCSRTSSSPADDRTVVLAEARS